MLVDNELMILDNDGYSVLFDNRDYKIILVSLYSLTLEVSIVENMIYDEIQLFNIPDIQALGRYFDNGIGILADNIGDLKITVWGVSK